MPLDQQHRRIRQHRPARGLRRGRRRLGRQAGLLHGVIGGPLYTLIDRGDLPALQDSTDLGNVILGNRPGRTDDTQRTLFVACGMVVFDVAWATTCTAPRSTTASASG